VETIVSFRNDGFASFCDLLRRYLNDQGNPDIAGCCIAIAGPVTATTARLTNRDWEFERADIAAILGGAQVVLINDLAALGSALPVLSEDRLLNLKPAGSQRRLNGQSIVVGAGTGFNVCLTRRISASRVVVIEAEAGHSALTTRVASPLVAALGADAAAQFVTLEDCFSGRGLSALYRVLSDGKNLQAHEIISAYTDQSDPVAQRAVALSADLLGRCLLDLIHIYLPFEGVYLAGGVARGILGSAACDLFLEAVNAPVPLAEDFRHIPISVIQDDAAALLGCVANLSEMSRDRLGLRTA